MMKLLVAVCLFQYLLVGDVSSTPSLDSLAKEVEAIKSNSHRQITNLQRQVTLLQGELKRSQAEVQALNARVPSKFAGEEGVTATLQRQYTVDINMPIPFDQVITQVPGTQYNATSGEFTCTTGGYYWVHTSVYLISTTTTLTPQIVVNFVEQSAAYAFNIGTSAGITVGVSAMVNCPANTKIWIRTGENGAVIGTPVNTSSSLSIFYVGASG